MFILSIEYKLRGDEYKPRQRVFSGQDWEVVSKHLNNFVFNNKVAWFKIIHIYDGGE